MNSSTPNTNGLQSYDAEAIQTWLMSEIAQQLNIELDEIDVTERLDSYGLDSAQAIMMANKAEKLLGFKLSPLLLWHYPTIASLSQRIAEDLQGEDTEIFQI
jgi:acyl carrier protein